MRVLFQNRDPNRWDGGDFHHLNRLRSGLEANGVETDFNYEENIDLQDYDLVSLFNINYDWSYFQALNAHAQNKPIVVNTIYFSGVGDDKQTRWLIENADCLSVFSKKELAVMEDDFEIEIKNYAILPNGIDEKFNQRVDPADKDIEVLTVGTLDKRKNQSMVVKACNELGITPVLIGDMRDGVEYMKCKEEGEFIYHEKMPQDDLLEFYARAKVLCQPSLQDPYPNVTLEAGFAGCNIAMTEHTYIPDDFPSYFWCDPCDVGSVKNAIEEALKAPYDEGLRERLDGNTWKKRGGEAKEIYEEVIYD